MNVFGGYLINIQAGEALAARDWCYIKISDGRAYKADRTDPAKKAMVLTTTSISSSAYGQVYAVGIVKDWPDTLTPGTIYYLSDTAGAMTSTKPLIGNVQVLGLALSASEFKIEIGALEIGNEYAEYAVIATAGDPPTVTEYRNTTGTTFTWSRDSTGIFLAVADDTIFVEGKTTIEISNQAQRTGKAFTFIGEYVSGTTIKITVIDSADAATDNELYNQLITVKVWP